MAVGVDQVLGQDWKWLPSLAIYLESWHQNRRLQSTPITWRDVPVKLCFALWLIILKGGGGTFRWATSFSLLKFYSH